ncbi:MAG: DUF4835 family protein [Bacteroidia bacterium]|nr:DUF4835 family protein [Bacteroidia bacterium]
MRVLLLIVFSFLFSVLQAQEINSTIQVVAPGVQMTNKQILTTLQNAIQQFVNTRKWTEDNYEAKEKIELSIFFNFTAISQNNDFQGSMQVTVNRPVFNSTYKSTVFNFSDEDVTFNYREFENLDYTEGQNLHDLTSLISFYVYMSLGYNYDSFGELGGTDYFKKAQNIVNLMNNKIGWGQSDGKGIKNRFNLAENLNNKRFEVLRKLTYTYHRNGMDAFNDKPEDARAAVTDGLKTLLELVQSYGNGSLIQKTFFSTKYSEIIDIYTGATVPEKNSILELLAQLDPSNTAKYQKIKS